MNINIKKIKIILNLSVYKLIIIFIIKKENE